MKLIYTLILSLICFSQTIGQSFITTWKTDNPGTSNSTSITIPTNPNYTYSYNVDWNNDGVFDQFGLTGNVTHDYGTAGIYQVAIQGNFPAIYFNNEGDKEKIISLDQWGDIQWKTMHRAFYGASNLGYTATDAPNLSFVTDLSFMFTYAVSFDGDLSNWNVSNVTNMEALFAITPFNHDISNWNVSNVTNMAYLFDSSYFNQDISNWNVANVSTMFGMFQDARTFNQDLSNWTVDNVSTMAHMFLGAIVFNRDLGDWNITNVGNMSDMLTRSGMSIGNYDKTLIGWSSQNVQSNVSLGATNLFYCNSATERTSLINNHGWTINEDTEDCSLTPFITTWKTDNTGVSNSSSITIPTSINYTYSYDVDWNNDGVFDEFGLTGNATHDYGTPGTYQVAIKGTFPTIKFNGGGDKKKIISIDQWGSNEWQSMEGAFRGATNLMYNATDVPELNSVTTMSYMFYNATLMDGNFEHWNISNITDMTNMLSGSGMSTSNYDHTIIGWESRSVQANVSLGATGLDYCSCASKRNSLISNSSWNITGDNENCALTTFITSWKTDNIGVSNSTSVIIPAYSNPNFTFYPYSYDVDWNNDGIFDEFGLTGDATHDYGTPGTYQIAIRGTFPAIYLNNSGDKEKLVSIDQWGGNSWKTMVNAFHGATNMIYNATDIPDLSQVTTTSNMFNNADSFNADLSTWDVSSVRSMASMFYEADIFNGNVSTWDVSNVYNMYNMFNGAVSFNRNISTWDVSNVTNMYGMFYGASSFNGNISSWDVSKVTSMAYMFREATSFNGDLSNWNVSNVTNLDFMFYLASAFNSDLSNWNVSNVTSMYATFGETNNFNSDLSNWDVSSVTNMYATFYLATNFNSDLSNWNVSNVTDMDFMFYLSNVFNSDLSNWDVSNVTTMYAMFTDAPNFNSDLSNWNVSNVTNMDFMFSNANSFDSDLGNWNISNVTSMVAMLNNSGLSTSNYDRTLIGWGAQTVQSNVNLGATGLDYCTSYYLRYDLINNMGWNITGDAFNCQESVPFITTWKTDNPGTSNSTSITIPTSGTGYFYDVDWNNDGIYDQFNLTGSITHDFGAPGTYTIAIRGLFPRIYLLANGDEDKCISVDQWGDIAWTDMGGAFAGSSTVQFHATDQPILHNVTSMSGMFSGATNFNSPLNHWDVSNVTNFTYMFFNAEAFNQNINDWDMTSAENISFMLDGCISFNQPLNNWNTSNITDMTGMFYRAFAFDQPLNNWDVSNVSLISGIFRDATSFNQPLDTWDVSNVTDMSIIFWGATSFDQYLGNWDISNAQTMSAMLENSGLSITNYDNTLISWSSQNVQPNVNTERMDLINTHGWNIGGDENRCSMVYVDHTATGNNDGSSWINAFTDLQDALILGERVVIHIAEGVYKPTQGTQRGISFDTPSYVTLQGGYPNGGGERDPNNNITILSGEIDGVAGYDGNSYHVVKVINQTDVILEDIHIKDGSADDATSFGRARGGGIYCNGSDLRLNNVTVRRNKAIYGGGLFATLSPLVSIYESEFKLNQADYGSALYHSNQTNMYIQRSRIIDNNSLVRCAIEVNNSLYTNIDNSVIANNASTNANAIGFIATNRDQSCDIYNSTILGETKDKYLFTFQIGFGDQLDVNVYNSIVAHQDLSFVKNVKAFNNGVLNFTHYNCYFQGSSIIGNGTDNLFSDIDGDLMLNSDYSVHECSPVVDVGNDTFLYSNFDIDGYPRYLFSNPGLDIGAYEAQIECTIPKELNKEPSDDSKLESNTPSFTLYPNPTQKQLNIKTELTEFQVVVSDILGKQVATFQNLNTLDLSDIPEGAYILSLYNEGCFIKSEKFIKQ